MRMSFGSAASNLRAFVTTLVVVVGVAFGPQLLIGQTSNGSIIGTVTDSSGASIPGATVTVTSIERGVAIETTTSEIGTYRVYPLDPGNYRVSASTDGFQTQVQPEVVVQLAAIVKLDFGLEIGEVTETVEVTTAAPLLQTQEASVGGVVNDQEISRLPVNGRNYTRLMVLLPGSSDVGRSQTRGTQQGTQLISVNGQRRQDNNITLDGVDNNIMMQNSPGASPPMDSIQEFRVATGNSAEFGRSAGASVNIAIKSGTNALHGTGYWFGRNDAFDANPWFNNFDNQPKGAFRQNQYGANLGGPVVKNKTFFFASWEGFRRRRANTQRLTTPTAAVRGGDFSDSTFEQIFDPGTGDAVGNRQAYANNMIPTSQLDPSTLGLINLMMPTPNTAGFTNNLLRQESESNDRDIFVFRGDHRFSDKDTIFGRYLDQTVTQVSPNNNPNLIGNTNVNARNLAIGWTHVFGASTILEVKYAWNNPSNPNCTDTLNTTRGEALAASGVQLFDVPNVCNVLPAFEARGWFTAGGGGGNLVEDNNHQFIANITKISGQHSMKAGVSYTRRAFDAAFANPGNGNMWFDQRQTSSISTGGAGGNAVASMLLGHMDEFRRSQGIPEMLARQFAQEYYFQDDWRVSSKLTINLGVRYDYMPKPVDVNDALGNLIRFYDEGTGETTARLAWAGINPLENPETGTVGDPAQSFGTGRSLTNNDTNNWAPRIGLAYQIDSKTVIRAGLGVFYNSTFMQETQDLRKFWPYNPQQQVSGLNQGPLPDFEVTNPGPSFNSTQAIGGWPQDPNNRSPYSSQWNLFIQRQVSDDVSVEIGYVGSSNKKQIGYTEWNNAVTPHPTSDIDPRRPLFSSGFTGNIQGGSNMFNSEYNSLQFKLLKRFSDGLQLNMNYTYANCMDEFSSLARGKIQDQFNRRPDWSRCDYDIRHAFKMGYVYDIPFGRGRSYGADSNGFVNAILGGWSIEGITQIQSGTASNVVTGSDVARVGRSNSQRPDALANPNEGVTRDANSLFNTSAFGLAEVGTFGDSGAFTVQDEGRVVFDVSIMKQFAVMEGHNIELRGEFFNLPNVTQFVSPRQQSFSSSTFGQVREATPERQIQFGLRYRF
jgi:hypothetical protein